MRPFSLACMTSVAVIVVALIGCADPEPATGEVRQDVTSCVELPASDDATIDVRQMFARFGTRPVLRVGGLKEALVRFDLSSIPAGAAIDSASLDLWIGHADHGWPIYTHRVTAPWLESTVTFYNFRQRFDWRPVGAMVVQHDNVRRSIDLGALVKQWIGGAHPNHGVMLSSLAWHGTTFVSKEGGTTGQRPTLKVCYSVPDDHCAPAPCQNGSTCENTIDSYVCRCQPGFTGPECAQNIDECAIGPCQNGGSCGDGVFDYTCACPAGFTGKSCETNEDNCDPDPCQHGGVCEDGIASYTCRCLVGYSGANCEIVTDSCADQPCQNGGACSNGAGTYTCSCPAGFTGTNCEINIDDCAASPCQNAGTCIDGVDAYTCACPPAWGGPLCEVNLDLCAQDPCLNGGSCQNGFGTYTCACAPGYGGVNCEIDLNDCAPNPCLNDGLCVDRVNGYTCTCADGFTGTDCEVNIDDCTPNPCQNGGSCSDGVAAYTCGCTSGFSGANCELNIDDCAASPCLNGGTCIDGVDAFTCQCPIDYSGVTCETAVCDDGNVCTLDHNSTLGCTHASNASGPACAAAAGSLDSGGYHSCAIREAGRVYCWGYQLLGRLGDGVDTDTYKLLPGPVTGIDDAVAIAAGYDHSCVVRATGGVACWGNNSAGQLGSGDFAGSTTPRDVPGVTNAISITAGRGHTCALTATGDLWCWGSNTAGQLGDGTQTLRPSPVAVINTQDLSGPDAGTLETHAPIPWLGVTAGDSHTCATRPGGEALCWGSNFAGQLGAGLLALTTPRLIPSKVVGVTDAYAVSAGRNHACAVRSTGGVACWGSGVSLGRINVSFLAPIEIAFSTVADAVLVSSSGNHSCVTRATGQEWCWGEGFLGQLGNGLSINQQAPAAVTDLGDGVSISGGYCTTCTLRASGAVSCWGGESDGGLCRGQLGNGTLGGANQPVTVSLPGR